ncbi:MAG TPA: hemerythrin domain-containing protein [Rhizomicrobium sp.]|nr:hemerythrin domain-containing protein [Rhizomicrobium sp.]
MTDAKKTTAVSKTKSEGNATKEQGGSSAPAGDAEALLKSDHRRVEGLFQQYESADDSEKKKELARQVCLELIVHTRLEEEIFYPACREKGVEHEMLDEAQVEHDGAKTLIAELLNGTPDDEYYSAKVTVLSEYIKHHVAEEEKPQTGIFATAREDGVDMNELGKRIQSRKSELMARSDALLSRPPQPRSLHNPAFKGGSQRQEDYSMARYANDRDRDEYGRFTSDDDDRRGSRGGYSSRGRYDDDNGRGYRGNDRPRDEEGRFMSENGDRSRGGYSSRSRRYDDDDDYRSSRGGGRGHGGWFGDSEGHSEASERGWESRGGSSRGSRYDEDDDERSSRGGGRGHGGWFGDSEGHSEASERGWEHRAGSRGASSRSSRYDDENGSRSSRSGGGRGWYGDPEGHSEASEKGWEHRAGSRGNYSRSSRYDDDDRRSSRGGGHGGWFGDPRGHSEASRRGWENR